MTADTSAPQLPAEARARVDIDRQLVEAGWVIQDHGSHKGAEARGVAIREVTVRPGDEYVDGETARARENEAAEARQRLNARRPCSGGRWRRVTGREVVA